MASEAAIVVQMVASVATASEDTVMKQPHKLERKWTFWFNYQSKPKQGATWGTSLLKLYTFDIIKEFWCLYNQIFRPSKLPTNADFQLFKAGIKPKWEDLECANGGKWSIPSSRKAILDNIWLETIMISILVICFLKYYLGMHG